MLVKFQVDLNDDLPYPVVISTRGSVNDALTLLRRRLNCVPLSTTAETGTQLCEHHFNERDLLPPSAVVPIRGRRIVFTLQIRNTQGEPVPLSTSLEHLGRFHAARDAVLSQKATKDVLELTVLIEGSENALKLLRIVCRKQPQPSQKTLPVVKSSTSTSKKNAARAGRVVYGIDPDVLDGVDVDPVQTAADNITQDNASDDTSSDGEADEDDEAARQRAIELNESLPRLHFMKIDRAFRKAFTTRDAALGSIVAQECPQLSVAYPLQLVNAVRSSEKLMGLSYAKSFATPSSIEGVSDEDFAKYLSIAMTHGLAVVTGGRFQVQIAVSRSHRASAQLFAKLCVRATTGRGTILWADSLCGTKRAFRGSEATIFVLISTTRRLHCCHATGGSSYFGRGTMDKPTTSLDENDEENICGCSRCWRWSKDRHEQSMSGAFYVVPCCSAEKEAGGGASWKLWMNQNQAP